MNFKHGDRVKIRKDSQYFRTQGGHGVGTITNTPEGYGSHNRESINVSFSDGYNNTYKDYDLIINESINDRMGANEI